MDRDADSENPAAQLMGKSPTLLALASHPPSDMKKRVAILWENLGPYHVARLGALKSRFDVTAIELFGRESLRGWSSAKTPLGVSRYTLWPGDGDHCSPLALMSRVWKVLSRSRPEVVLAPGYAKYWALVAAGWARLHGVPVIMMSDSTHMDRPRSATKEGLKRAIIKIGFSAAHVAGIRSAAYLCGLGVQPSKIGYCYDVVDNHYFESGVESQRCLGREVSPELPRTFFLYVGRFAPEKNLERLIEAFRAYRSNGGSWDLVSWEAARSERDWNHRRLERPGDAIRFLDRAPSPSCCPATPSPLVLYCPA